MNKEQRQLEILRVLSDSDFVSGEKLSEIFSVSLRTIYRDVEELLTSGITIEGAKGIDGGYRLRAEVKESIQAADSIEELLEVLGPRNSHISQRTKSILDELPPSKLLIDRSAFLPRSEMYEIFKDVCDALQSNHAIQISTGTGSIEIAMPLGLVFSVGRWLLIKSDISNSVSALPISILEMARPTELSFRPPKDFKIEDYSTVEIEDSQVIEQIEFTVLNSRDQERSLIAGVAQSKSQNGTYCIGPVGSDFAIRWLASMGPSIRVERPEHIKIELKKYAQLISRLYD